jgi:hypothetical protein
MSYCPCRLNVALAASPAFAVNNNHKMNHPRVSKTHSKHDVKVK